MYIIENFPESTAAEIYLASADELLTAWETYASARGYYTHLQSRSCRLADRCPDPVPKSVRRNLSRNLLCQEYYASWGGTRPDRQQAF